MIIKIELRILKKFSKQKELAIINEAWIDLQFLAEKSKMLKL